MELKDYYKGKKVFITGHTGFKGAWLTKWLLELGAIVSGVSLPKVNNEAMFYLIKLDKKVSHYEFDIREKVQLEKTLLIESPEIIFHLAAQPLVLESYNDPHYTHLVNYVGTLNLLEAIRTNDFCKKLIIITSDKVYKPHSESFLLNEDSVLGGIDPYSASKSAVELLVASYRESYFKLKNIDCITVRAGNVIGYGDWGKNRLLPDIFRSIVNGKPLEIRNPGAVRPWQDVNDVILSYLVLCIKSENLIEKEVYAINIGPHNQNQNVVELVNMIKQHYPNLILEFSESNKVETKMLILDTSLAKLELKLETNTSLSESVEKALFLISLHYNKRYDDLNDAIIKEIFSYIDKSEIILQG